MLDIFSEDPFTLVSLTDTINNIPFIPGQATRVVPWQEEGIRNTTVGIEQIDGTLALVNPTPRGGPGKAFDKEHRVLRMLSVPHYQIDDGIYADEVQGMRAFGEEDGLATLEGWIERRMQSHVNLRMDPTLEYQRIGALKGIILNADGSTLYNLYNEFGVSAQTEVDFNLDAATATGAVRAAATGVVRTITDALGGLPFTGVHAFVSREFMDALMANAEVRATYQGTDAAQLRQDYVFRPFPFGGITFEEYRGSVNGTNFIEANKAYFFPLGVPGMYRTVYAPADYNDTVNTIGLPRYSKIVPMTNDKGVTMEMQTNALSWVARPRALVKGKLT